MAPCYFFRGISLKTLMESAFVDDIIVIFDPFLRFSPVFCPVVLGEPRVLASKRLTGKFFQDLRRRGLPDRLAPRGSKGAEEGQFCGLFQAVDQALGMQQPG
jgi:hypothetical protein